MPLPGLISFGGKQQASGTVHALGPKASFQIKLPAKPTKVSSRFILNPLHELIKNLLSASAFLEDQKATDAARK